jgi:predicted nucleic acid-binding protein
MAVIDASVQVALLNGADRHHDAALVWFRQAMWAGEPLSAPWILVTEVAAALGRGLGDPGLAHRAVRRMVDDTVVELVAVDSGLATRAAALAVIHGLRGCDAVYVALAAELGEPLVTLDQQQGTAAGAVVEVRQPGPVT